MEFDPDLPAVTQLADRQLAAYNAADVDGFCACYADDVIVLDERGTVTTSGMAAFRERYAEMFRRCEGVRAAIRGRVSCGHHVVEHETARRRDRATGQESVFELLVRYTEVGGKIAIVEFLRG